MTVLPGHPFVPFFARCPGFVQICSSLQSYAYASVAKNRWPKISSDIICIYEKSLVAGTPPRTLLEELTMFHQTPKSDPLMARACGTRILRFAPSELVLDCYARIMVTLPPCLGLALNLIVK